MHRHRRHVWALALLPVLGLAALPLTAVADDGPVPQEKKAEGEKADAKKAAAKPAAPKRRPLLWMVESNPRVFLYGTIHVADPRVTKHLPVVQAAFDQSTALYTELPMDAAGQQKMQQVVMSMGVMTDGKKLEDVLGVPLHQRVGKALPPQMPIQFLGSFKPWLIQFVLMQTMMAEHQKAEARKKAKAASSSADVKSGPSRGSGGGVAGVALDPLLYAQAEKDGKQVGGLETIKAQIDVFDSLSVEAQVKMVEGVVEEIEKIRAQAKKDEAKDAKPTTPEAKKDGDAKEDDDGHVNALSKMIDMWLAGDDQGFMDIFEKDLRKQGGEESQKFVEGLLDNRNVGMAKKVQELMKAHPDKTFFIAVGAAHMPGKNGVVQLLTDAGLKVRRMELGDKVPAPPKKAEAKKAEPEKVPAGK